MFLADQLFHHTRTFPHDERFSLTDQVTRASRSVTANLAESRRKCPCQAACISKPNDAESEAAETRTWFAHAVRRGYLPSEPPRSLLKDYQRVIGMLVTMPRHSKNRVIHS